MTFHFIRPWWLLALFPFVSLVVIIWRLRVANGSWQQQCDPHLLNHLLVKGHSHRFAWNSILLCLAGILCIFALAGPAWIHKKQPIYRHSNAHMIVLDVSDSMNAQDISPTRLQQAKYKVLDLLKRVHEGQTGMLVFSRYPFVVSPLTEDSNTIAAMVPVLETNLVPVQGERLSLAIKKAGELLEQSGVSHGDIILMTDSHANQTAIHEAARMRHKGYRTFVLGVGGPKATPITLASGSLKKDNHGGIILNKLDTHSLKNLATAGGGRYVAFSTDNSDIKSLLTLTDSKQSIQSSSNRAQSKVLWVDEGHWFIWILLLIAACAFRRGWWERLIA